MNVHERKYIENECKPQRDERNHETRERTLCKGKVNLLGLAYDVMVETRKFVPEIDEI